jgi:hypothetical protein
MIKLRLLSLIAVLISVIPSIALANLQRPENIRVVVDEEQNQAKLIWSEYNPSGDIDGYQFELINEPAGSSEVYQIVEDLDGVIDDKATISLAGFDEEALIRLRMKTLNGTLGDSEYSDIEYLKLFPKEYNEDFETTSLGDLSGQNGWIEIGSQDPTKVVGIGSEGGNVFRQTDPHSRLDQHITQGFTGANAKIRARLKKIGDYRWESPFLWMHGQGDRGDAVNIVSPRYGAWVQFDPLWMDYDLQIVQYNDSENFNTLATTYVGNESDPGIVDFTEWYYLELETFEVDSGLLLRASILDEQGDLHTQVETVDTSASVTFVEERGFYGISNHYVTYMLSDLNVKADDFRVPPSAPSNIQGVAQEEALTFEWDPSDLGGAEAPEGKYELMFEQVGGGVTQDFVTTETTFTKTGLNPESTYRLTIRAVNDGYQSPYVTSANISPTPDQTNPTISNKQITYVDNGTDAGSFRITWKTNEDAKGRVTYGFNESSTLAEESSNFSITGNTYGRNHSTVLTKLAPCTKYRGRIRVRDEANNLATSPINFTTRGCAGNTEIEEETNDDVANTQEKEIELRDNTRFQAKIRVPENVSNRPNLNFQIKRLVKQTFIENVEIPESLEVIAEVVNLSALEDEDSNVSEFDEPIEVTLAYDDTNLTLDEEQKLVIYRYGSVEWIACEESGDCIPNGEEGFEGTGDRDGFWTPGEEWEQLTDCSVDTQENTVTCSTSRFSSFTVMRLLGGGNDTQEESPSEETPVQNDTNQDSTPQDISESIPEDQPNTYANRPFASLSRAVSSRNLALNVIEEETARTNSNSDQDSDEATEASGQDEERTKREDQNKVAEEISNIEEEIRENPRTRWYLGITISGVLLLAIAVAWMSQRGKM